MATNAAVKISPVDMEKRRKLDLRPGNTVRVWQKIQEKGKTRLQAYEGMIIAQKHGNEAGATFTVRKVASGVGMEKIFPIYSPNIDKIEVVKRSKVRRSKLYYVRDKAAREIRRRMKRISGYFFGPEEVEAESEKAEETTAAANPETETPAAAEEGAPAAEENK